MIHLNVKRIGILDPDCGALKVVGKPRERRRGRQTENPLSNGADAVRRNNVAGKRLPPGSIGIAGGRIINDLRRREPECRAEVTVSEIHRRNAGSGYISAAVSDPLIVSEEESFVLNQWPTERESELVVNGVRPGGSKDIAGRERIDAVALVDAAMQVVTARSQRRVDHSSAGPPEFGLVVAGGDIH